MSDVLQKICEAKRGHIAKGKLEKSLADLESDARHASPPRGFEGALQDKLAAGDIGFITEIKKASPSAGVIGNNFSPTDIAQAYQSAGAACLSVLTDEPYFQGCNQDLIDARAAVALPVLRKDFMLDVWQVMESRAIGADCILLIMAALDDAEADDLHAAARSCGMDVLIETHDENELDRALRLPSGMIGINNRNLKTLTIDLGTTLRLAARIPRGRLVVSESGIVTGKDIAHIGSGGVGCFLIGESLLKTGQVAETLTKLREVALNETKSL